MKKFSFCLLLSAFFCAVLTSGCALTAREKYETASYDLQQARAVPRQNILTVGKVINSTPGSNNMLYRMAKNKIVQDPFQRWIQTPDKLLNRYYDNQFPLTEGTQASKLVTVYLEVTAFEFDIPSSEAVLTLSYIVFSGNNRQVGTISEREKFAEKKAADFVSAMSRAADRAGQKLYQAAKKIVE